MCRFREDQLERVLRLLHLVRVRDESGWHAQTGESLPTVNHTGSNESPEYLISFDALASLNPESLVLVSELVDVTARCAINNQCAPCGHVAGLYPGSSPPNCTLMSLLE